MVGQGERDVGGGGGGEAQEEKVGWEEHGAVGVRHLHVKVLADSDG